MSNLKNRVQLIGHLGMDPELKEFESGKLATLSLATNESYKNTQEEWKDSTTWHRLVAWGPLAERVMDSLKKGSYVLIEGKLTNREYLTENQEKRTIYEVRISNFVILDKKNDSPESNNSEANFGSAENAVQNDDNLPF